MRTKQITSKRQAERLKSIALEKHGKALYDLSVRYCFDVRMTYGNDRKKFVEQYNKEWKEYCHANLNKFVDLNPQGFINFATNKDDVKKYQMMLKIYFEPDLATRVKNILSKY